MTNGKQKGEKMAVVQNRERQQKESKNVDPAVSALQFVKNNPKEVVKAAARIDLLCYARYMKPNLDIQPFHKVYYKILNKFAHGEIKRLIVTMPPQHGKSEGSSRIMPSFVLGNNPDKKIAIGSYSTGFARDFNRDVQKIIDTGG